MATAPFWEDAPDAWDTIIIAGAVMPGHAIVSGDGISRDIDLKKSPGRDGARLRDRGYQNAKFSIEIQVWEADQLEELQRRLEDLQPKRRGGTRNALDVAHPALAMLGITAMYVEGIGMPTLKDGSLSVTLKAIEWYQTPRPRPSNAELVANVQAITQRALAMGAGSLSAVEQEEAARARARQRPPAAP